MAQASPFATFIAIVRTYWKGLTLCLAVATWLAASVTPKFGFVTKLSFGSFLLRTYWPEILVALVLVGVALILLRRFGVPSTDPLAAGHSMARRALETVRQVTVSDHVYGLIVVVVTVGASIPLLWKQVGLMLEAEQAFYATRLMNWFGDDLHRIAARQINDGNYAAAVRTLKVQAGELGEIEEGRTAASVAASLASRIAYVDNNRQRTLDLMKRAGVVRSDLLMLGVLHAMLLPHALGAEHSATVPGAESVQAYLGALRRIKSHCDSATGDAPTPQDVGMAAAALGFARSPGLLFGRIEDPGQRAEVLCGIVRPLDAATVDKLHRAAFSVGAPSERTDWRMPVQGEAGTPGIMVIRSFGRAVDTVIERATGLAPLKGLLPVMESGEAFDRHSTSVLESAVVTVVARVPTKEAHEASFESVTLIGNAARKDLDAYARVDHLRGGIQLTLCIPSNVVASVEGYLLKMREDGRLQITGTEACAQDTREADAVRPLDASLLAAIVRFIALIDSGRAVGTPPTLRGSFCRVLVAGVPKRAPDYIGTAINLCPLDTAAARLAIRPATERR